MTFSENYDKKKLSSRSKGDDNITTNEETSSKRLIEKLHELGIYATQRGSAIMAMTNGKKATVIEGKVYFSDFEIKESINPKDFECELSQITEDSVVFFPQL